MDDGVGSDLAAVDVDERDLAAVAAPPVAVELSELFLGDVVGEAEGEAVFGVMGQLDRG